MTHREVISQPGAAIYAERLHMDDATRAGLTTQAEAIGPPDRPIAPGAVRITSARAVDPVTIATATGELTLSPQEFTILVDMVNRIQKRRT